jgi:hypothetical protein
MVVATPWICDGSVVPNIKRDLMSTDDHYFHVPSLQLVAGAVDKPLDSWTQGSRATRIPRIDTSSLCTNDERMATPLDTLVVPDIHTKASALYSKNGIC